MRIDAFRPATDFKEHMDRWIRRFRTAKVVEGQSSVLIPGDPERKMQAERLKYGIPLQQSVNEDLVDLGVRFGIIF